MDQNLNFEPEKVITSQVISIRVEMETSMLPHRKKEIIISIEYFHQVEIFKKLFTKKNQINSSKTEYLCYIG